MLKTVSVGVALAAIACLVAAPASATPIILDQQNTAINSTLNGGSSAYEWEQGITAGITGQLTQFDIFVSMLLDAGDPASTQLFVNLGAPWQSDVNAWSIITTLNEGWNSFDLTSASIFVAAGEQFVIGVHGQSASNFNPGIGISYGDLYTGGRLYLNGLPDVPGNDIDFRTYVNPEPVPEPSSFLLLGTGVVGVCVRRWRKRLRSR